MAMVDAFWDELPRIHALQDLRMLDVIVAPHAQDGYYRDVRDRLAYVVQHGMTQDEHLAQMDPEELREHNRRQFAALRSATAPPPVIYGPDGTPAT